MQNSFELFWEVTEHFRIQIYFPDYNEYHCILPVLLFKSLSVADEVGDIKFALINSSQNSTELLLSFSQLKVLMTQKIPLFNKNPRVL